MFVKQGNLYKKYILVTRNFHFRMVFYTEFKVVLLSDIDYSKKILKLKTLTHSELFKRQPPKMV